MNVTEEPLAAATNGTCDVPGAVSVVLGVFLSVVALVTVTGNLLTVAAFLMDHRSLGSKPPTYFILSLSCADLLVGLLMFVRIGQAVCDRWPFGELGCELLVFFNDVAVGAGMWSMTNIALDRYLLISRDYPRYLELQSRRGVLATVVLIWSGALGAAVLEVVVWEAADLDEVAAVDFGLDCLPPPRFHQAFALTCMLVYLTSIVAMVGLSLRFLVLLRRRLAGRRDPGAPPSPAAGKKVGRHQQGTAPASAPDCHQMRVCGVSSSTPTKGMSTENSLDASACSEPDPNPSGDGRDSPGGPSAPEPGSSVEVVGEEKRSVDSAESGRAEPKKTRGDREKKRAAANHDRYVRPAIIMGTLVTAFLLFTLPYFFFFGVVCFCPDCYYHGAEYHLVNLFYLNSCVNPFLYAVIHPKIRRCQLNLLRSVARFLTCRRGKQTPRSK